MAFNLKITRLVENFIETYRGLLAAHFGQHMQVIKPASVDDLASIHSEKSQADSESDSDFDSEEFILSEEKIEDHYLQVGLTEFLTQLGLKKNQFNYYHDAALQKMTIVYFEEKLKRTEENDLESRQLCYQRLSEAYFSLAKIGVVSDEIDLKLLSERKELQEKGVNYLRRLVGLQSPELERPTLEDLYRYSGEFVELSHYYDANGFDQPEVKVRLIMEAIETLMIAVKSEQQSVEMARIHLMVSDYYYHLAIIYRDEFAETPLNRDEAKRCFREAKAARDSALQLKESPMESPQKQRILKLVRSSDRHRELLKSDINLAKPVNYEKHQIEESAEVFMSRKRRDDSFHQFLGAFGFRFKPLTCMVALYNMHREANRARENNDFYEGMNKFENFMAGKINRLNTPDLKRLFDHLNGSDVIDLVNGLMFQNRYYDRLGLHFDSNNIETAMSSNVGKLHTMFKKTMSLVRCALRIRGVPIINRDPTLSVGDISDGVVLRMKRSNQKALEKVLDSINKGKIALLPKEGDHCRSYRQVVRSFRYYFDPKMLRKSFLAMYQKLSQEHRDVLAETERLKGDVFAKRCELVQMYLTHTLGLTTNHELLWLHQRLSSKPVVTFMSINHAARLKIGTRNHTHQGIGENMIFLDEIMQFYREQIRKELTKRGIQTHANPSLINPRLGLPNRSQLHPGNAALIA